MKYKTHARYEQVLEGESIVRFLSSMSLEDNKEHTRTHTHTYSDLQWDCAVLCLVVQLCLTLCDPMDYTVHGIFQARILVWVAFPSTGDLPNPGIEPRSPTLQANSLPVEPQGKSKNTGMGSLSLLQPIFPTQE